MPTEAPIEMPAEVSFDRAAPYYDATRSLPETVVEELVGILRPVLDGREPCLEIGVGTGRIALPLIRHGASLVGCDISRAMLAKLTSKAASIPLPLLRADATALPLETSSVGVVLAVHVLHLVSRWQQAVDEAMRALRGGGSLVVDFGGFDHGAPWSKLVEGAFGSAGIERRRPGVSSAEAVGHYLSGRATARRLRAIEMAEQHSLSGYLDACERQINSWTWAYDASKIRSACDKVRDEARSAGWPLDEVVLLNRTIQLWSFDKIRQAPPRSP